MPDAVVSNPALESIDPSPVTEGFVTGSDALLRLLVMFGNGSTEVTKFQIKCSIHRAEYYQRKLEHEKADASGTEAEPLDDDYIELNETFVRSSQELAIVYATAIFDSFLNTITRFVFFSVPNKVLKDEVVHTSQLLAKPPHVILQEALTKRSEKVARDSFLQRIRVLENILDVKFNHAAEDIDLLKRIVKVRNTLVHDANSFQFGFGRNGEVVLGPQTVVEEADLELDTNVFDRLVPEIYEAVVKVIQNRE